MLRTAHYSAYSRLPKERGTDIISLWCSLATAVLSGDFTRTGPWGAVNTLRPAAFMFPKTILAYHTQKCKHNFGKTNGAWASRAVCFNIFYFPGNSPGG